MKKIRYYFRLTTAFITRFKGLILLGVVFGVSFFFLLSIALPLIMNEKPEYVGVSGRYRPDKLPNFILEMIGDGLTQINESGITEPSLATSWETPDKGKTWIFYLKEGSEWHDKVKLDSNTINYEFSDVTISRPDEKTLVFNLQNPFSPFPSVVSKPTFRKGLVGTGDWKVENITVAAEVVQEITLKNKEGKKIVYKFYPTLERTKLAYKLGEVNKISGVFNASPFESWNTAEVLKKANTKQVVTIFFNTRTEPFKDNKSLRQALAYSIDKRFFSEEKAISPIYPKSWAYNPQVKPYEFDLDRAKNILGEIPEDSRNEIEIELVTTPILLSIAERIEQDWNRVGIKTTVQVSSIIPSEFDAYLTILDIPDDPDQYSLWHSTQIDTNISGYSNPRIDKLLEEGRIALDYEERRKIYLDFQRFLLEDLPATFLYHPVYYEISKK